MLLADAAEGCELADPGQVLRGLSFAAGRFGGTIADHHSGGFANRGAPATPLYPRRVTHFALARVFRSACGGFGGSPASSCKRDRKSPFALESFPRSA